MKKAIVFLFILVVILITGCENGLPDPAKLKEGEIYVLDKVIEIDNRTKKKYVWKKCENDIWGNITKEEQFDEKGKRTDIRTWVYNEKGEMLKRTVGGSFVESYEYDEKGRRTKIIKSIATEKIEYWDNNKEKSRTITLLNGERNEIYYDKKGYAIKDTYYYDDGTTAKKEYTRTYYENGNKKTEISKLIYQGQVSEIIENKFDEKEKMVESKETGGVIDSWHEFEHDKKGNTTKFLRKNKDGTIDHWNEYLYDKDGNQVVYKNYVVDDDNKEKISLVEINYYKYIYAKQRYIEIIEGKTGKIYSTYKYIYKKIKLED